jgi:hypothetical protein
MNRLAVNRIICWIDLSRIHSIELFKIEILRDVNVFIYSSSNKFIIHFESLADFGKVWNSSHFRSSLVRIPLPKYKILSIFSLIECYFDENAVKLKLIANFKSLQIVAEGTKSYQLLYQRYAELSEEY